jgi:hypothetical protein
MTALITIYFPNGSSTAEYTVIEKYEDGSVLAVPTEGMLLKECEGKPTIFSSQQIRGYKD